MADLALSGLRVIELAQDVSGPYCGKLLAGLGAEVIKVEPPTGDSARRRKPFFHDTPRPETSGLFLYLNMGKLGVTLDVTTKLGQEVLLRLVRDADVLVESCAPGYLEGLGLGSGILVEVNPRLIRTRITPWGQTGAYRNYRGGELVMWGASGYAYITPAGASSSDVPPLKMGGYQIAFMAGANGAMGTMAALVWRERSGEGQEVDVSEQETAIVALDSVWSRYMFTEDIVPTRAVRTSFEFFPCKDGYLSLLFVRDDQWERMVEIMGNPEWASDLFKDGHGRRQNWDLLHCLLSEWFMQYTKQEIYHLGQAHRIPLAPVNTGEEVANSPQLNGRDFFIVVDHPMAGPVKYPGAPYKLSETPWQAFRPAPLLGQHNGEVYCNRLGYGRDELAKWVEAGIV